MGPTATACPCDAGRSYELCCAPYHRGEREAPDPVALMRSRYAAFVRGDDAYLLRTMHPDNASLEEGVEEFVRGLKTAFRMYRYEGLRVLDHRPPASDRIAEVLFLARVKEAKRDRSFVERSYFAHDGAGWRYLAGELQPAAVFGAQVNALTLEAFARTPGASS